MKIATERFVANGRTYAPPGRPVVVICLDGSADEYLDAAMVHGRMPRLKGIIANGIRVKARAAMPTFTNVNNASIVTGCPPSVHGICGNYFYDGDAGGEVMMNSARFLRAETIFPAACRAGRKVAVVTAKEKLLDIFAAGLIGEGGIAFSSEKAAEAREETHGIGDVEGLVGKTPAIYSADASLYVLRAGVVLLEREMADLLYLSTTDFMQHKHGPEEVEALDFYGAIDVEIGKLADLGAVIGLTADHGMNAKCGADGSPKVIYLEKELEERFGSGFRVILPITDPYVLHHGALGSFAQVHVPEGVPVEEVKGDLLRREGITECHERGTGARLMELAEDRIGDLQVASGRDVVLGRTPEHHDLSALGGKLRSHGGRYEEMVPLIFSERLQGEHAVRLDGDVRNFDVFDLVINGTKR